MALGLLALALSFVLLFLAARRAETVGKAGMLWMVAAYLSRPSASWCSPRSASRW